MAPFFLFYYYQGPLQATLQALNLARAAMINSLIGAVVKTAVIFLLASQPAFGINGVAMGILTGTVLVTMLHFATVLKAISFTFFVRDYIKTFIAMIVSGGLGFWMLKDILASDMNTALRVILISAVITIVYIILLLILKLIKKNDLVRIPGIGKMISRLAFK
jgi:stage V sporulation protein B